MSFLASNIDRAIVMTQYDLRGFSHPLGPRIEHKRSDKYLAATTANFMAFAAGAIRDQKPTDERYAFYSASVFAEYCSMCRRLAENCDGSQREAIQLIVREIVKQGKEMGAEVVAGTRESTGYLGPLDQSNPWGRALIALAVAFELQLEDLVA